MTVYSHAALIQNVRGPQTKSKKLPLSLSSKIYKLNVGIVVAILVLVAAYIILANTSVSQSFALKQKRTELQQLSAQVAAQEIAVQSEGNLDLWTSAAQRNGMVVEQHAAVLYAQNQVALQQ